MNGTSYIDLGLAHIESEHEANYRCAISRYYYGLLHNAIEKVVNLDIENEDLKDNLTFKPDAKYSIHSSVIRIVKQYNSAIAGDLDIAKRLRVIADYNFEDKFEAPIEVKNESDVILKTFDTKEQLQLFLNKLSVNLSNLSKPVRRLQTFTDFRFK